MSYGAMRMQLDGSNLSLSNNGSFVSNTGRNGLFVGNNNTYGNSDNILAIGETLDIRDGNKNIFTLGNQVDHIDNNQDSFFGGSNVSWFSNNINTFTFGDANTANNNTNVVFFGMKSNISNETDKFIVGNNDKKWLQVDMNNGEVQFAGNPGAIGQIFISQWASTSPTWQTLDTSVVPESGNLYFTPARAQSALSGIIAGINTSIGTLSGQINTLSWNLATLSWVVATKIGLSALSASGPLTYNSGSWVFGINTANSTTTGALSVLDYNAFSGKINFSSLLSGFVAGSGTVLATDTLMQALQKLQGSNTAQDISINNLAISFASATGSIATLTTSLTTLSGQVNTLSGNLATTNTNLANLTTTVNTLSGNIVVLSGWLSTLSGRVNTLSGTVTTLQTNLNTTNTNLATATGSIATLQTNLATATGNIATLSWQINTLSGQTAINTTNIVTLSWNLATTNINLANLTTTVNTLSGTVATLSWVVATKIGLTSLSALWPITYNNTTGVFSIGNASATTTGALTGTDWTTFNNKVGVISGVANGLSIAGSGISLGLASATATGALSIADYNTFSGKLNLTSLLTGFVAGSGTVTAADSILQAFQKLQGSNTAQDTLITTANNNITTLSWSLAAKIGLTSLSAVWPLSYNNTTGVFSIGNASATTTGALTGTDWTTFNNKINLTSLSATWGITYNNTTGLFGDIFTFGTGLTRIGNSIGLTTGTAGQVLTMSGGAPVWTTLSTGGITSLNWLTGSVQTFAIGTGWLDFNIVSSGSVHTFNLPNASATARGLVSTGAQTFAGAKTFNSPLTIDSQQLWTGWLRFTQISSTSTGVASNGKVLTIDGSGNLIVANMAYGADLIASKTTALTAAMSNTAQVVIFNTETQDINNGHNNTTGIYTTPTDAADIYTVEAQLWFTIPNQLSRTPCIAIRRAGVVMVSSCNPDYNNNGGGTTGARSSVVASATLSLTAWQTIDIVTYTDTNPTAGTVPTFSTTAGTNYLVIKRVGNAPLVTSDSRLKKNIESFTWGLEDIRGINTVAFEYNGLSKNALNDGTKHIGIIAQEVQSGSLGKWAISTGPDGFLRYDPNAVIYSLVNSVKEIDKKTSYVYLDSKEELEYQTSVSEDINALDRFSYMVKKSLAKIDPSLVYSGMTVSGSTIQVTATDTTDLTPLELQIATFSGQIAEMQTKIVAYESLQSSMQYLANSTGSTLWEEDVTALSLIRGTIEWVFIDARAVFAEMVTFTREVVFESIVTFRDTVFFEARVVFSDPDMAGTAEIREGTRRIHIDFQTPYARIPVVTISPVGHYIPGTISNLTKEGFDIEIATSTSDILRFNWMALIVTGASSTRGTSPVEAVEETTTIEVEAPPPAPEIPTPPASDTSTGDTVVSDSPTWTWESSTGSEIPEPVIPLTGSGSPVSTGSLEEPVISDLPQNEETDPAGEITPPEVEVDPDPLPETIPVQTVSWESSL
jgi:hypothetical protein